MHSDQEDVQSEGDSDFTRVSDKGITVEDGDTSGNSSYSKIYSRLYYEKNKDKAQAYNREYSAKIRADPVKKELINAKKREMMRRLAERRKEERGPAPVPRGKRGPSESTTVRRRNYRKYYAENKETMRQNNQRYSHKVRSDPEKRAQLNEKKKLAMRRLKERRLREKELADGGCETSSAGHSSSVYVEEEQVGEVIHVNPDHFIQETYTEINDPQIMEGYFEEVVVNDDDDGEQEEGYVEEQEAEEAKNEFISMEDYETPPKQEEYEQDEGELLDPSQDIFPFAMSAYRAINEEEKGYFIAYIEQCAQKYFQQTEED